MSLFQQLIDVYDNAMMTMDFTSQNPMAPIAHFVLSMDIEITIDSNGNFLSARLRQTTPVKKKAGSQAPDVVEPKRIISPVTERSLNRVSSAAAELPHCLNDKLMYFLPDNAKSYELFMTQLRDWAQSKFGDVKLTAILAYLDKNTLVQDLVKFGAIELNQLGKPKNESLSICWRVTGVSGRVDACWQDTVLMDKFERYQMFLLSSGPNPRKRGLCMITGEVGPLAHRHAKGILPWAPNAKLISSVSSSNNTFTYFGRFAEADDALSIGYVASQKTHNALTWLIANFGVSVGNRSFVAWCPNGKPVLSSAFSLLSSLSHKASSSDMSYKKQLSDALMGYRSDFPDDEDIILVAVESATNGCLSVVYYNEMSCADYFENLLAWDSICSCGNWSPTPFKLAYYAYGTYHDDDFHMPSQMYPLYSAMAQRLISARLEGNTFPFDVYNRLVRKASNLAVYDSVGRKDKGISPRERLLRTAIAAVKKYRFDTYKEDWDMNLDRDCLDRSYLFGRLLAVAEYAERKTYKRDETREPTAIRFQRGFAQQPSSTWQLIYERLQPYLASLTVSTRNFLRNELETIMNQMPVETNVVVRNARLSDLYLLGYYHERAWLREYRGASDAEDGDDMAANDSADNNMEVSHE